MPHTALITLLTLTVAASSVSASESDGEWLRYNNGTAQWFTWEGASRCVWFDVQDFVTGAESGYIEETEFWFYHSTQYPWDSSDFHAEIWTGNLAALGSRLDETLGTAIHNSPVYITYDPPVSVDRTFWVVDKSDLSWGGWPSILADDQIGIGHSWKSDISGLQLFEWGEYFIGVNWSEGSALTRTSWGQLKSIF